MTSSLSRSVNRTLNNTVTQPLNALFHIANIALPRSVNPSSLALDNPKFSDIICNILFCAIYFGHFTFSILISTAPMILDRQRKHK